MISLKHNLAANDLIQASALCQVSLPTLPRAEGVKMRGFSNGLAQRCMVSDATAEWLGQSHKDSPKEASYRIYYRFVAEPHLLSAPLSAVGKLGENRPMFSCTCVRS